MTRNRRNGRRQPRNTNTRVLQPRRILVITDAEQTEKNYFEGMQAELANNGHHNLQIEVIADVPPEKLVGKCIETRDVNPNYADTWIVFDRDRVPHFDDIIREAQRDKIKVAWSNPCFEVWLTAYFSKIGAPVDPSACYRAFARIYKDRTGVEYKKSDRDLYKRLITHGDEKAACDRAKQRMLSHDPDQRPSRLSPGTTVQALVRSIRGYD